VASFEDKYRRYTGPSESHKAFNSLKGIIEGIGIDKSVNDKEIAELEKWCKNHEHLAYRNPFKDLITNIQVVISDNIVTPEEIKDMLWLCEKFEGGFEYYDQYTSDLQKLQGICHGILSDGVIHDDEIHALKNWLNQNTHLTTYYPYDDISEILYDVLKDGVIDPNERKILKKYFNDFVHISDENLQKKIDDETIDVKVNTIFNKERDLRFIDNKFCFTGKSKHASRKKIEGIIKEHGGNFSKSVAKSTNYLIVGTDGNECWAYATYGRKVEKAIQLQKEGHPIKIIHEDVLWDELIERQISVSE
jgi:NAD-dependent DNA ligase